MRVRDFLFIDPLIGVELIGLIDMWQAAGFVEAAIRQFVRGLHGAVLIVIGLRAGVQHQAGDAVAGENIGGHAAGVAGAHDDDVVLLDGHWVRLLLVDRWVSNRNGALD